MKLRILLFVLTIAAIAAFGLFTQAKAQEFEIGPRGPRFEWGERHGWHHHHDWDRDDWRRRRWHHHHHWHDWDDED